MRYQDIPRGKLKEESSASSKEIEELKVLQMRKMQMEIDTLNEVIKILKKDRGIN